MVMDRDKLSQERKKLQEDGLLPDWYTTAGWQLFKDKYLWASSPKEQYKTIANTLAQYTDDYGKWKDKFFELLWNGWLSPSTPVLANTGSTRGLPVSCSGGYVEDSIDGFYSARHEAAMLTKYGFGTSAYLGDIRPRGTPISVGGKAAGILPVLKGFVQDSRDVSQGGVRRGSWAGYIPVDHGDFWEILHFLEKEPDDLNIGWVIPDAWIDKLQNGDVEANKRFSSMLRAKLITGKGYFSFTDKANRAMPACYPLSFRASNLCNEIVLPSDSEHTFTCVLSSMNVAKYDEWKDTDAVFTATVFLDCVASDFIQKANGIRGLEKAVRFTDKARALGLGVAGLHTYLQYHNISMGSLGCMYFNDDLFRMLDEQSRAASAWMGSAWGVPQWMQEWLETQPEGTVGYRNCSRIAVAPTKSTALIMGGISEGINPDPGFVYTQATAGGEVQRIAPALLKLMKERGVYDKQHIQEIVDAQGSVQKVDWLSDEQKVVFRTAFEIGQKVLIRLASARAKYIDQWQSLNLFFAADEDPRVVVDIHKAAFQDPNILGLYYIYSKSGVAASKDCEVCM